MYDTIIPSTQKINLASYRDKVLGCWTGKNIGGTLGAPFEGKREMNSVTFYTQELDGKPTPNDDLDLQLIWLIAAEENGLFHLNERILGEYWLTHITGPWNEYAVCKANIRNGLTPPLSGSCNNDTWKYSNGAWIRSEIWACLFPGSPDEAGTMAYIDACCDHCGEGIYAEIFTAAMEAAAFVCDDIRDIIRIGLARIPADSLIAGSVNLACDCFDHKRDFKEAREAIVAESADLGWFQAPANIGFVILGLLYGEGDFGRSICLANNCGDDTDCTAGTVGAIIGILLGRSGIPDKWIKPIGETIQTCSIDTYGQNNRAAVPQTLGELTERVIRLAVAAQLEDRTLPRLVEVPTQVSAEYREQLLNSKALARRIWNKSPYELTFDLPFGCVSFDYDQGPEVIPGHPKTITVGLNHVNFIEKTAAIKLLLPEGWTAVTSPEVILTVKHNQIVKMPLSFIPADFNSAYYYLPVEIRLCDRFNPIIVHLPLQHGDCVMHFSANIDQDFCDEQKRHRSRND